MSEDAPSANPSDFDFIIGRWRVRHRRLRERLAGCHDWVEFGGQSQTTKILGGFGNLEDQYLELPEGAYRAVALRSFEAATGQWSIWWLDGRRPSVLDVPVRGGFSGGIGTFFADDRLDGQAIKIRFKWLADAGGGPEWEQAFSSDAGASWESNWIMSFIR